ncbi:uncharacterized protein LOC143483328 [Brachyhypopomus gauderio]|uniref:uncharacterized protein LOC143483328 n=1 Tax=Brachyhypopomus gauderio TaxID=698409 RepID=UPI004043140D
MKTLLLTLSLVLLVMTGSALECNKCLGKGCIRTVETCYGDNDACITAIFSITLNHFSRCSRLTDCLLLRNSPGINAVCSHMEEVLSEDVDQTAQQSTSKDPLTTMKTLLLTLSLALLVMTGSALKCNKCIGTGCIKTVETCLGDNNACITAIFTTYPFNYFSRCIKLTDCLLLSKTPGVNAVCCQTDRCN